MGVSTFSCVAIGVVGMTIILLSGISFAMVRGIKSHRVVWDGPLIEFFEVRWFVRLGCDAKVGSGCRGAVLFRTGHIMTAHHRGTVMGRF